MKEQVGFQKYSHHLVFAGIFIFPCIKTRSPGLVFLGGFFFRSFFVTKARLGFKGFFGGSLQLQVMVSCLDSFARTGMRYKPSRRSLRVEKETRNSDAENLYIYIYIVFDMFFILAFLCQCGSYSYILMTCRAFLLCFLFFAFPFFSSFPFCEAGARATLSGHEAYFVEVSSFSRSGFVALINFRAQGDGSLGVGELGLLGAVGAKTWLIFFFFF